MLPETAYTAEPLGARDGGGTVALVLADGEPPSIFRFRGVDRRLSLFPSRTAALEALRR